jgi:hypothetical protein
MTPLQKGFFIAETAEYAEHLLKRESRDGSIFWGNVLTLFTGVKIAPGPPWLSPPPLAFGGG